jgi:hypothetical protein
MESVIEKIRQARDIENKKKSNIFPTETVVDGCQVRIRFDEFGDEKIMSAIQSMLISAHMDASLTASAGGEFV